MSKPKTDERIKVKCHCGAQLMAPRKAKGKRVKCPRCRKALTVPEPGSTVDQLLYALGDEEYNKPALEVQPESPQPEITERGTKLCPNCKGELKQEAVFCTYCGSHLDLESAIEAVNSRNQSRLKKFLTRILKRK